jgi:hypothetical protein
MTSDNIWFTHHHAAHYQLFGVKGLKVYVYEQGCFQPLNNRPGNQPLITNTKQSKNFVF